MSSKDIAEKADLSRSYVASLSARRTWKGIPIDVVERFTTACGVDILNPTETILYMKEAKKHHLQKATPVQRKFFAKILGR